MKTYLIKISKRWAFALTMMVFLSQNSPIQAQDSFQTWVPLGFTWGGLWTAEPHPQGGYMAFGSANTWDQGDVNILVRFQDNGDTLWVKKFYRYSDITIEAVDMVKAVDNSGFFILIVQKKYNYGYFRNSNAILKVNLNGDSLWQKTITPVYEYSKAGLRDIKATPDGGFVVAGANSSLSENLIMKLSPTAEIEWENSTSNADIYPYYANVAVAPDGNYFAVGITSGWHPTGDNDKRLFLRKIDANGNTL